MRIMHVSANVFPSLKTHTSTREIWRELARDAEEYHVVGISNDRKYMQEREGNITLHRFPKYLKGSVCLYLHSWKILRIAKRNKIDIILAQCGIFGGVQAILCQKFLGVKVVVEIHGDHYFTWLKPKNLFHFILNVILRWVYRNADTVRVLNERMMEMLQSAKVKGNFKIVYNRVNMSIFSSPKTSFDIKGKICLISVGSFVERKGYRSVINTIGKSSFGSKVDITLIGGGEQKELYENLAKEQKIPLHLYDRIPQESFVKLLHDADIYIQPSYSEAVPRAIIEAMAMRMPILASNAGMIDGLIIHGENGLIFEKNDPSDFLEKLELLISDGALRKRLAENAFKDACEKYEWNKCFDHYRETLYTAGEGYIDSKKST